MKKVILSSGGEPVCVMLKPTDAEVESMKQALREIWKGEKVTVKVKE